MALDLSMITEFLTVEFLISTIFTSVGSFFVFNNLWSYKIAKQTINWPKTTGTVLNSRVTESWRSRRDSRGRRRGEWVYSPEIYYSYNVNDQVYHSSQIFIGSLGYSTKSRTRAYNYLRKYPKGKKMMVHYIRNIYQIPDKSEYSVLETGVKSPIYFGLFMGLLCGIGGSVFSIYQYSTVGVFSSITCLILGRQVDVWTRRRQKKPNFENKYPTGFKKS